MKKMLLLVLSCGMLLGTSCPGGSTLVCSNNLDGSRYGFTMTVPADFACVGTSDLLSSLLSQGSILGLAVYTNSAGQALTVIVFESGGTGGSTDSNIQWEDLPDYTTANGLVFSLRKGTATDINAVEYEAMLELSAAGNVLGVLLDAEADADELLTTLQGALEGVQLTGT